MMPGRVRHNEGSRLEAWLTVAVADAGGELRQSEVMIDTGFTGWIALPGTVIETLGLTKRAGVPVTLATGEVRELDTYFARVFWLGALRPAIVFETEDQHLLGMQLLRGNVITIQAWDGGDVIIEEAAPDA